MEEWLALSGVYRVSFSSSKCSATAVNGRIENGEAWFIGEFLEKQSQTFGVQPWSSPQWKIDDSHPKPASKPGTRILSPVPKLMTPVAN
ncbi:MAG: hypothetical protein JWL59_2625 [Chthoniobacteraceae bacterium]|nr:hypothetical protein [Chthoniobacteraceae bacterium]